IYAMGGTPLMAIAILGWPVDKISEHVANRVIEGGRDVCKQAKIPLAGGHSIDNPEPLFGLAVTGRVDLNKLKRNDTAKEGCKLYLTKPLGVGILATAHIDGVIKPEHANIAPDSMMILNSVGKNMAEIEGVTAMTDVTGFGLLGHLIEMCEGSDLSASLEYDKIPVFEPAFQYIDKKSIPGGTKRNWESYGGKVILPDLDMRHILADAQTSGGLLIAVMPEDSMQVEGLLKKNGLYYQSIGKLKPGRKDCVIEVV
ncbi:MAG: selenide, water dikinase SelD, partial [Bacteroidota bacterium]